MALAGVAARYGVALTTGASNTVQLLLVVGDLVAVYAVGSRPVPGSWSTR
ncbi:hypothetical protein [Streptomyces sp. NPDC002324]